MLSSISKVCSTIKKPFEEEGRYMMDKETFRQQGYQIIDWITEYYANIEDLPVMPDILPNAIKAKLADSAPTTAESFGDILQDFEKTILPGMTHWQHPSFFAYFPSNTSPYSLWADVLASSMNAQCMSWITSPAATELEERVMLWLRDLIGLPGSFVGVIQDGASTASLCALLSARERFSNYKINRQGFSDEKFTIYASEQAHSSIDKAVRIAGLGSEYLRKIEVDSDFALIPEKLEQAIKKDIEQGYTPLCVIAAMGTTGSTAIDPIQATGDIAKKYGLWFHIDAAYAGTALLLPEMRWMAKGAEMADSFVFNPHKWMFTNFDCSAYFVKDKDALIRTFAISPEYLKTNADEEVNNYRDWGIPLGRRFRALKLWFVLKGYGVEGIQEKLRGHLKMAQWLRKEIEQHRDFQLLAPTPLNLVCFHFRPKELSDIKTVNRLNKSIMDLLNKSGKIFLTHTSLDGVLTLRMVIAQTDVRQEQVENAWSLLQDQAKKSMEKLREGS